MDITVRRDLVMGRTRGIGFDIVQMSRDTGILVAINGGSEQSAGAAMEKFGDGKQTVTASGNIGTVAGCESAVQAAIDTFGIPDDLVNDAGVGAGRLKKAKAQYVSKDRRIGHFRALRLWDSAG